MKKIFSLLLLAFALLIGSFNNASLAYEYEQVEAYHILVPNIRDAFDIRSEILEAGSDQQTFYNFMSAAKRYSKCPSGQQGGYLGWFKEGQMVKPFEKEAFTIEVGKVSNPIETQFGYHLIFVTAKK